VKEEGERSSEYGRMTLYLSMEIELWSLLKLFEEVGRRNKGNGREYEFDRGTLYTCMEVSQWNHFVQLICANIKIRLVR
jgi:hypothetical protein